MFTRDEADTIISDERIRFDRRIFYAFMLLGGLRPGEVSAARWRHYDAAMEPLGKLTVAKAYNKRKHNERGTKTNAVRHVPVHATLAAMLAEWKLSGWAAMMGRRPRRTICSCRFRPTMRTRGARARVSSPSELSE